MYDTDEGTYAHIEVVPGVEVKVSIDSTEVDWYTLGQSLGEREPYEIDSLWAFLAGYNLQSPVTNYRGDAPKRAVEELSLYGREELEEFERVLNVLKGVISEAREFKPFSGISQER